MALLKIDDPFFLWWKNSFGFLPFDEKITLDQGSIIRNYSLEYKDSSPVVHHDFFLEFTSGSRKISFLQLIRLPLTLFAGEFVFLRVTPSSHLSVTDCTNTPIRLPHSNQSVNSPNSAKRKFHNVLRKEIKFACDSIFTIYGILHQSQAVSEARKDHTET